MGLSTSPEATFCPFIEESLGCVFVQYFLLPSLPFIDQWNRLHLFHSILTLTLTCLRGLTSITKLQEGRKLPFYSRRRYVQAKARGDFLTYRNERDVGIIQRQVMLAEDMLESLKVMSKTQRSFWEWEEDPVSNTLVNGKPIRRQPPPRDEVALDIPTPPTEKPPSEW